MPSARVLRRFLATRASRYGGDLPCLVAADELGIGAALGTRRALIRLWQRARHNRILWCPVSGRNGYRSAAAIAGDRSDLAGFARLTDELCEDMAARGYSERTIGNHRHTRSFLRVWIPGNPINTEAQQTFVRTLPVLSAELWRLGGAYR